MTVEFYLDGQQILAFNGYRDSPSPAVSPDAKYEYQGEANYVWDKLSAGGSANSIHRTDDNEKVRHCGTGTRFQ